MIIRNIFASFILFLQHRTRLEIASFFLFLQVLVVFRNIFVNYWFFFWICDLMPILFAFAFFFGLYQFVYALIYVGCAVQLYYVIAFILKRSLDVLGYISFYYDPFFSAITIILHLTALSAFFIVYRIPIRSRSLLYAFCTLLSIFLITYFFTPETMNINYVFSSSILHITHWTLLWVTLYFIGIIIPTFLLCKWIRNALLNLISS